MLTTTPAVIAAGVLAAVVGIGSAAPADADSNMSLGDSRASANMWLAASVINLYPEQNHLTGY